MSLAQGSYGVSAPGSSHWREVGLWGCAALVVLAAHAGAAYYFHNLKPIEPAAEAMQEAMIVDLAPLALSTPEQVATEEIMEETPPTETTEEAAETTPPEEVTPVEQEVVETVPPEEQVALAPEEPERVEETEPVETEPVETAALEPEEVQPDVVTEEIIDAPQVDLPDSDVPLPVARPQPPEPREVARERPRRQRERAAPRPQRQERREQPVREARPRRAASAPSAARASTAPRISPAQWQSRVNAHINRRKGSVQRRARERGVAHVRFSINGSGAVTSAGVSRSSGSSALDRLALELVNRSSPVPAPPDGQRKSLTVPVNFDR